MSSFYAWLSRLRLIRRWGLMNCAQPENDAEHSLQVAMIAHGLALMARDRYHREVNPEHVVTLAVYHDVGEVFTGDLVTPVKHHDSVLHNAYKEIEQSALTRLTNTLPTDLRSGFTPYLQPAEDTLAWRLVKAADRISAYAHCLEEIRSGNRDFSSAAQKIRESIDAIDLPEVADFMQDFAPAFSYTLDELEGI